MTKVLLEMKNIIKDFPGVRALDHVNLEVEENTVHAVVGENGAGKSTLMNVLSGVYPVGTYQGRIILDGEVCKFEKINDSEDEGIVIIHQELALIPTLSIAENMFLGNERMKSGVIDWNQTKQDAEKYMEMVGLDESPETIIQNIGVGKQQLVEIAKALAKDVRLLILDEPTASLNDDDSEKLLNLLLRLQKEENMTFILISHKLNEVEKVSDSITIIRDGKTIETLHFRDNEITEDRIIRGMVGRELVDRFPSRDHDIGDTYLEVKNWEVYSETVEGKKAIDDISFTVKKGEILGITGLMGSGRTELAMSLFGKSYGRDISGKIIKDGKELEINTIQDAIDNGIGYVTEDRKEQGLILIEDIRKNVSLASLDKISNKGVLNKHKEIKASEEYFEKLNIKSPSIYEVVDNLSGGNQQKVMLSRWIYADPDILILDEPTRGIDIGAKFEIYSIINELTALGKSIILISSELPEVLGMSDRVYVMNEGKFVGEFDIEDATQEKIMESIMNSNEGDTI